MPDNEVTAPLPLRTFMQSLLRHFNLDVERAWNELFMLAGEDDGWELREPNDGPLVGMLKEIMEERLEANNNDISGAWRDVLGLGSGYGTDPSNQRRLHEPHSQESERDAERNDDDLGRPDGDDPR